MSYVALVIGSTGAVGRDLVAELVQSAKCAKVIALSRREIPESKWSATFPSLDATLAQGKLEIRQVDFDQLASGQVIIQPEEKIDAAFSCLGTTRKVDLEYTTQFGELAKAAKVPYFGLLTASNANKNSWFLYPKTKGEAEESIKALQFERTSFFRPGLINRGELMRTVEIIGSAFLSSPHVWHGTLYMAQITTSAIAKGMVADYESNVAGLKEWSNSDLKKFETKNVKSEDVLCRTKRNMDPDQWVQLLNEGSNTFYCANLVAQESTWEAPPSFIKREDIDTAFQPSSRASESEKSRDDASRISVDSSKHSPSDFSGGEPEAQQQLAEDALPDATVTSVHGEPLARLPQIPTLKLEPVVPETSSAASKTKTKQAADPHDVPTESHPLFAFARKYYNLTTSAKSCLFNKSKPLDLRSRLPVALQAFRNISGFTGNRSSGKGQIDHCFKLLRNVAPRSPDLKDEIYCQLCKQLTRNPDMNTVLNGWLLLNACLITFPPSKELSPYLEQFFAQHAVSPETEIALYAVDAIHSLQSCFQKGERKELPSPMEIHALRDHSLIEVIVSLVDGTPIKASVSAWTTCGELSKTVSQRLGIRKTQAFALFECSSLQEERVVEADERILDLYALWERIGIEKTGKPGKKNKTHSKKSAQKETTSERTYKLLYKVHLWIHFDDELVEEISLVYLQAVHNVVSGVYVATLEKCIELASYQLHCKHGVYQSERAIDLVNEIGQYIPPNILSPANRVQLADQVLAAYAAQRDNSVHECRRSYLRLCKTLRFYGAAFFAVHNTRNPKMPTEIALAVHHRGLTLVSVENEAPLAQYLYVDIASWGYSANSFVFVVAQGNEDDNVEHVLKTSAGKHINDIIAAYVNETKPKDIKSQHHAQLIEHWHQYTLLLPDAVPPPDGNCASNGFRRNASPAIIAREILNFCFTCDDNRLTRRRSLPSTAGDADDAGESPRFPCRLFFLLLCLRHSDPAVGSALSDCPGVCLPSIVA
ncbi:Unconventional myosin heavy chain 6, partial [Globisporangium splendens]